MRKFIFAVADPNSLLLRGTLKAVKGRGDEVDIRMMLTIWGNQRISGYCLVKLSWIDNKVPRIPDVYIQHIDAENRNEQEKIHKEWAEHCNDWLEEKTTIVGRLNEDGSFEQSAEFHPQWAELYARALQELVHHYEKDSNIKQVYHCLRVRLSCARDRLQEFGIRPI